MQLQVTQENLNKALGMVARVAAVSTELVYSFLRHHLAALEPFLGACPYAAS